VKLICKKDSETCKVLAVQCAHWFVFTVICPDSVVNCHQYFDDT